jgi:NAD(P)-dependent dehydrogenase (short-subunit alcohol dehydrogenase family)
MVIEMRDAYAMNDPNTPSPAALVIGASGGLGNAFVTALLDDPRFEYVYAVSRTPPPQTSARCVFIKADSSDPADLSAAIATIQHPLTRVITTTGMLHDEVQSPEKSWRALEGNKLARSFAINCIAPALALKETIPLLPRSGRCEIAALGARVGSISDNRNGGWYGYRASKAALAMIIKTLAIDLARTHPDTIVALLHPGTVDTGMSKPFQSGVAPEKLFTPAYSARAMLAVLNGLTSVESGGHFAWNGDPIPA